MSILKRDGLLHYKNILILVIIYLFLTACSTKQNPNIQHLIKIINQHYIEDVILKKNEYPDEINSIESILNKLDKYTLYLDNESYKPKLVHYKEYSSRITKEKYLYLKVPYFKKGVSDQIAHTIKNTDAKITKIILDLRNNPGGKLNEAIKIVDLFLDEGLIITIRKKDKHNVRKYFASTKNTLTTLPLIILVNNKSASSSEIVAGALKYSNRAILVGEKTYGKGTIQAMIYLDLHKTQKIRLSVAKYYFLNNKENNNGIYPDIYLKDIDDSILKKASSL